MTSTHKDDGRLMRNILLKFDVGTQLSAKVLDRNSEMGVLLKMELVPLSIEGKNSAYTCFVVARVDRRGAKRGKIDYQHKKQSKEAELDEKLEKLGV